MGAKAEGDCRFTVAANGPVIRDTLKLRTGVDRQRTGQAPVRVNDKVELEYISTESGNVPPR